MAGEAFSGLAEAGRDSRVETNVKTLGEEAGWKSEVLALVVCGDDRKRLLGVLTPHDLLIR